MDTRARLAVNNERIVSVRELSQDTSGVLRKLEESGEPLLITRYGRFIGALVPLSHSRVEQEVLGDLDEFIDKNERLGLRDDETTTPADLREELGLPRA